MNKDKKKKHLWASDCKLDLTEGEKKIMSGATEIVERSIFAREKKLERRRILLDVLADNGLITFSIASRLKEEFEE